MRHGVTPFFKVLKQRKLKVIVSKELEMRVRLGSMSQMNHLSGQKQNGISNSDSLIPQCVITGQALFSWVMNGNMP
jgi:hypothetical protein